MGRKYDLEERLIDFAVGVCHVAEKLPSNRIGIHISGQLVRSGLSPAPNYGEAQGAESRKDFIHKMRVCLKELRETRIWLKLIDRLGFAKGAHFQQVFEESGELVAIFTKSLSTARQKQPN